MADAIVTDINEYRASKKDYTEYFSYYEDHEVLRLARVLRRWTTGEMKEGSLEYKLVFPEGYHPESRPEHNTKEVDNEIHRRGLA